MTERERKPPNPAPGSPQGTGRIVEYRARWVVPVTSNPIENGALTVSNGEVVGVGAPTDGRHVHVHDFGDVVLLPGFVNAHTHLELTGYRDRIPAGPLWPWLDQLIALRRSHADDPGREREGVRRGAEESAAAGVTCVGDISRTGIHVEVHRGTQIRKVCFCELITGASQPPASAAQLQEVIDGFDQYVVPGILHLGVSPHAPYTVTREDLVATAELAARHRIPLTMHVLESAEERDWMLGRSPWLAKVLTSRGLPSAANRTTRGAIGWLREAGLFSTAPLLAHANYLDSADLDVLAAGHASVAWCPRAHAFFGHAAHPWQEMLAAGVNVCIATDSLASNASLSLLDELRWVYGHHPEVSPALLVAMATLHGARALRLDHLIGSLQPGRRADFVTIPMDPAASPTPLENLVSGRSRVRSVFVDGLCVATTTETG